MLESTVARCEGIPLAKRERLRLHGLRHTCASRLVATGAPVFDAARARSRVGHGGHAHAHFAPVARRSAIDHLAAAPTGPVPTQAPAAGAERTAASA